MNSLASLVALGVLSLRCPQCGSNDFQECDIGNRLVHCNSCFKEYHEIEWVEKVVRQGDDDPYIHLSIRLTEDAYFVQVNTDVQESDNSETIRFCSIAPMRSGNTIRVLDHIMSRMQQGIRQTVRFRGVKGQLKIEQKKSIPDIWLKTDDVEGDIYHGAEVEFKVHSVAGEYLMLLVDAMLMDCKVLPLPLQTKTKVEEKAVTGTLSLNS